MIPETVDINQYEFIIQDNIIREVRHRGSDCFVTFEPVLIGEVKNDLGNSIRIDTHSTQCRNFVIEIKVTAFLMPLDVRRIK